MYFFLGTKSIPWAKAAEADRRGSEACLLLRSLPGTVPGGLREDPGQVPHEDLSHVSGCSLPSSTLWVLAVPSSGPPPFHTNNCCWPKQSSHDTDNTVWLFCLPLARVPASMRAQGQRRLGLTSHHSPGAYTGPAGTEWECWVCLRNTRVAKCRTGWEAPGEPHTNTSSNPEA